MKLQSLLALAAIVLAPYPGECGIRRSIRCFFGSCPPSTTTPQTPTSTVVNVLNGVGGTEPSGTLTSCDHSTYPPLRKGMRVVPDGGDSTSGGEIGTVVDDDLDGVFVIKWDNTNVSEFKSYGANCKYQVKIYIPPKAREPKLVAIPYAILDFQESDDPSDVRFVRPGPKWNYEERDLNEIGVILSANTQKVQVIWPSSPAGGERYYNNIEGVLEEVKFENLHDRDFDNSEQNVV